MKIHRGTGVESYPFEPPASLSDLLNTAGLPVDRPCGGRGVCGKCLADIEGEVSPLNEAERKAGGHLICQTVLLGDADFFADRSARRDLSEIETSSLSYRGPLDPMHGSFGFAVDIGTTTVVVQLYDLKTGACLSEASERNDQITVAADVMGRIEHALKGELGTLTGLVRTQIRRLMDDCLAKAKLSDADAPSAVLTGNTTMLYLLTGRDPEPLSHAPFDADCLFGTE
ncbi:MAG: 2Fe-2S iron-sulfur cluster binding domain-containing protein, partial [Clostridia bacterium]|nr:2Fe-2S iron-sulfur cluster binding domain-containing protein [Clostridia bacterium]